MLTEFSRDAQLEGERMASGGPLQTSQGSQEGKNEGQTPVL